jgi:hypothetical protein
MFLLIASVVFGLIALGHVLRIILGWSFMVQDLEAVRIVASNVFCEDGEKSQKRRFRKP